MTHLYIEQNTGLTEEVNSSIISKLYELAISGDLDNTSDLKGRLHSTTARDAHVAYLNEEFDDLYITADTLYMTFADPQVEQIILNQGWGDGVGVTSQDLGQITTFSESVFGGSNITSFNEYKYFANATIQANAFQNCTSLTSIEYPPASTAVGGSAHSGNTALTHVKIDNTQITSINSFAFSGCTSLQSLILPSTCTTIQQGAFYNCTSLSTINLSNITSLGLQSFRNSGITSANLSSVTNFGDGTFDGCSSLQTVVGMSDVTSVSHNLFTGCTSLSSVDIDFSKVTSIGRGAFNSCSNLVISSLNAPNLTSLGSFAFAYGVKITTITDLGSITLLDGQIFRGCTTLTSVTLPNTITQIKNHVFFDCNNLTTINIPTSCTSIANDCFSGCSNLDVTLDLSNITDIGSAAFSRCSKLKISNFPKAATYSNQCFYQAAAITSAVIPKEVVTLGNGCFSYCSNLQSITFEQNSQLTTVGSNVFDHCSNLKTIILPEGCTSIGSRAFLEIGVTLLDIPSTVTNLGHIAFSGTSISATVILRCNVPAFDSTSDIFYFTPAQKNRLSDNGFKIYVPDNQVTAYKATTQFSEYSDYIFGLSQLPQS